MKKLFLLASVALLLTACKQSVKYQINWDMSKLTEQGITIDSARVVVGEDTLQSIIANDGKLVAEGTVDEVSIANIDVYYTMQGNAGVNSFPVILEEGTLEINTDNGFVTGTALNDSVSQFYTDFIGILEKEDADFAETAIPNLLNQFMDEHKDDLAGVMIMHRGDLEHFVEASEWTKQFDKLSDKMKQQPCMVALSEKIDNANKTAEGKMFTDFECEYEGQVQKLSDYVGNGKYVLVDFWASWCGPCRAEIPNLINVYKEYAGEKLDVIGVATWDQPDDTKKAIEELAIPYPQIMNAQDAGSKAYSIEGIPEIILFAPDGTILKRGLRGDKIEAAIKEVLSK